MRPNGKIEEPVPAMGQVVIEYDPATRNTRWKSNGHFPTPDLVNMLETIKASLVMMQLAKAAAPTSKVVGLDGRPLGF